MVVIRRITLSRRTPYCIIWKGRIRHDDHGLLSSLIKKKKLLLRLQSKYLMNLFTSKLANRLLRGGQKTERESGNDEEFVYLRD